MPRQARLDAPGTLHHVMARAMGEAHKSYNVRTRDGSGG